MRRRFDKFGKRLPETGYGCGCELCAQSNAPRYERRQDSRGPQVWGPLRRRLSQLVRSLRIDRRQAA